MFIAHKTPVIFINCKRTAVAGTEEPSRAFRFRAQTLPEWIKNLTGGFASTIIIIKEDAFAKRRCLFYACFKRRNIAMARSRFKPSATHRGKHKVRKLRKGCLPLPKETARK